MDADITREMIEKLISEQKERSLNIRRGVHTPNEPNHTKQHKAKKLADAMRKRQRGCKQRRTGVKPKR